MYSCTGENVRFSFVQTRCVPPYYILSKCPKLSQFLLMPQSEPTCGWKRKPGAGRMYLSFRVSNGSLILLFSTLLIVDFC